MIDETVAVFPNNIVNLVHDAAKLLDPDVQTFKRPLRRSDPGLSIGVFGSQWVPDTDSFEMGGPPMGGHEPSLAGYVVSIQAFVQDFDEERGLATSSVFSTMVRAMLFRNAALRVSLRALSVTIEGSTERTRRYGVTAQQFNSNEIDGNFLYLSTLEFWLETERV